MDLTQKTAGVVGVDDDCSVDDISLVAVVEQKFERRFSIDQAESGHTYGMRDISALVGVWMGWEFALAFCVRFRSSGALPFAVR